MGSFATNTVDSFKFLFEQIEREGRQLFTDGRDVLALLGAFYLTRKVYAVTSTLADGIYIHLLGEGRVKWVQKYGPWAVVTGSSEGIGFGYARELGLRGLNVILISRNERKLKKAKAEIEVDCKVQVEYIVADFSVENQAELYRNISQQLEGKEIGLLVNNVGVMYDYPTYVLNVSQQKLQQIINVNVGAATNMTHMLLPDMVKRGKGGIVVVTSGSSAMVTPLMTVYSATKKYLDFFIQGLAFEYRRSGVTFQCLCPFFTSTRMTGYSDRLTTNTSYIIPNGSQYAKSAVTTLGKTPFTTGYFFHTVQLWMFYLIPGWMWMHLCERLNTSLQHEAQLRLSKKSGGSGDNTSTDEQ